MRFIITVDDEVAAAIIAHHGWTDVENPAEAMRAMIEFTLQGEAKNAVRTAALKQAEAQIDATIDATLEGKFNVTTEQLE